MGGSWARQWPGASWARHADSLSEQAASMAMEAVPEGEAYDAVAKEDSEQLSSVVVAVRRERLRCGLAL